MVSPRISSCVVGGSEVLCLALGPRSRCCDRCSLRGYKSLRSCERARASLFPTWFLSLRRVPNRPPLPPRLACRSLTFHWFRTTSCSRFESRTSGNQKPWFASSSSSSPRRSRTASSTSRRRKSSSRRRRPRRPRRQQAGPRRHDTAAGNVPGDTRSVAWTGGGSCTARRGGSRMRAASGHTRVAVEPFG